jgi:hypothetical protein
LQNNRAFGGEKAKSEFKGGLEQKMGWRVGLGLGLVYLLKGPQVAFISRQFIQPWFYRNYSVLKYFETIESTLWK